MSIKYIPMSPFNIYKIVTVREVMENLKNSCVTLYLPEGLPEETRGILTDKNCCLYFNVIEE